LISPGARFAIFLAMASSLSWGDEVIIPAPSWGVYHQVAEYLGARIRTIKTDYKENWITRLTAIEDAISPSTKMIVLNHPNNPTGKILDRQTLKSIAKLGIAKGITLLSDETYSEYAYVPYTSLLEFWGGKCITVSSFSHTYSLSGFRIGYAISNPEIVNKMASLQRMMIRSVPEFIQEGAAEALASKEVLKENYLAMRDRVSEASALLNQYPVLFHKPDGGVYIFLKRRMESEKETFDSSEFSRRLLRQQGVAVSPGSIFGEKYSDFIRISLYQPKELLLEGIRRTGEALS
jgi:aspartate aminotransferase